MLLAAQLCPTLCDPTDCSLPGSSVHGISQARMLEWVAISSSRGTSHPGIGPLSPASPALAGGSFTTVSPGYIRRTEEGKSSPRLGTCCEISHDCSVTAGPGMAAPRPWVPLSFSPLYHIPHHTSRAGGACCLLHFMVWGQYYPAL